MCLAITKCKRRHGYSSLAKHVKSPGLQAWPTQENYEAVPDEWASINQKRHRGATGSQLDGGLGGLVRPELNLVPLL